MPSATEHHAGTYAYNDCSMVRAGHCTSDDLALSVLATVVSGPSPDRAMLDCGLEALTYDLQGLDTFGAAVGFEGACLVSLSEEHAIVDLRDCAKTFPGSGQMVQFIPNRT